ncbi:MAG: hypothetical protein QM811_06630 [Pirellulales bacterium]
MDDLNPYQSPTTLETASSTAATGVVEATVWNVVADGARTCRAALIALPVGFLSSVLLGFLAIFGMLLVLLVTGIIFGKGLSKLRGTPPTISARSAFDRAYQAYLVGLSLFVLGLFALILLGVHGFQPDMLNICLGWIALCSAIVWTSFFGTITGLQRFARARHETVTEGFAAGAGVTAVNLVFYQVWIMGFTDWSDGRYLLVHIVALACGLLFLLLLGTAFGGVAKLCDELAARDEYSRVTNIFETPSTDVDDPACERRDA